MKLDEKKASDYLRRFLAGDPSIKLPRLSFALQHMYEYDPDFQAAVDRSLANKDPSEVPSIIDMGQYLAEQLSQLVYGQSASEHVLEVEEVAAQERQEQLEAVAAAAPVVQASNDRLAGSEQDSSEQKKDKK